MRTLPSAGGGLLFEKNENENRPVPLEKKPQKMRARVASRLRKELADRGSRVSAAWSNAEMHRALSAAVARDERKKRAKARASDETRDRDAARAADLAWLASAVR